MKHRQVIYRYFLAGFLFLGGCAIGSRPLPPTGLMCELLSHPELAILTDSQPEFSWIVRSPYSQDMQAGYQIIVGTAEEKVRMGQGDLWDSGRAASSQSVGVSYAGKALQPHATYFWSVRVWTRKGYASPWSDVQRFHTGDFSAKRKWPGESRWQAFSDQGTERWGFENRHPIEFREIAPVYVIQKSPGHYFIDFGRAAFATIGLTINTPLPPSSRLAADTALPTLEVHLGEMCESEHSVNCSPPTQYINYQKSLMTLKPGVHCYLLTLPRHQSTFPKLTIPLPDTVPEVTPFRYVEIIGCPDELEPKDIRQHALFYRFDDSASSFTSSDSILNQVWELCRYTIQATSFLGIRIDGDRERRPYEGDSFVSQLGHYHIDRDYAFARYTHEYLIHHPNWPTEYIMLSVFMAWNDYLYTGDMESLQTYYEDLKAKTLIDLARPDGLIQAQGEDGSHVEFANRSPRPSVYNTEELMWRLHSTGHSTESQLRDMVDWPPISLYRDEYEFKTINTVINAYHNRALVLMGRIAEALGKLEDADFFRARAERHKTSFNENLFDPSRGLYRDGEGSDHCSLHGNLFPLAFGLVPQEHRETIVRYLRSRGMHCNVFVAQFLLEALYQAREEDYALELLTAEETASWYNMIRQGSTMTTEAWDYRNTRNMAVSDTGLNNVWATAPANIIPRYLMGVQPLEPGFGKILVRPQPGSLRQASLKMPTVRGTVHMKFENEPDKRFTMEVTIPANTTARVCLPNMDNPDVVVLVNGTPQRGIPEGGFVILDPIGSGSTRFERKSAAENSSRKGGVYK